VLLPEERALGALLALDHGEERVGARAVPGERARAQLAGEGALEHERLGALDRGQEVGGAARELRARVAEAAGEQVPGQRIVALRDQLEGRRARRGALRGEERRHVVQRDLAGASSASAAERMAGLG
jgi:hypothetical protein